MNIDGFCDTMFENENGARLGVPAELRVLIQPIGRGTTSAVMGLWEKPNSSRPFAVVTCDGSKKMQLMNSVLRQVKNL
jgi:hypothetical protein